MAAATKKAVEDTIITIKAPRLIKQDITLVGDSPLIIHAWSEKAKKEMLAAQQKATKEKKAKAIRDPFSEFMNSLYWVTPKPEEETPEAFEEAIANGAKFGFPITAIKQGAIAACYRAGLIPNQVGMKCSFYINAKNSVNLGTGSELAVIDTDEAPVLREDMVKIGGMTKTSDLRYRGAFNHWKIRLTVTLIDTGVFTMESIVNAINLCGCMNGIGEWRMERDGEFGMFHVEVD